MSKEFWVYIETQDGAVLPVSLELCCEIRKLCDQAKCRLTAVIADDAPEEELSRVEECGVDRILSFRCGQDTANAHVLSGVFARLCRKQKPEAVFVGATDLGRAFAPHFAAVLGTGCTSDATELLYDAEQKTIEFVEPAAGGKIMAVITIPKLRPQVGTIRPGTFACLPPGRREPVREQETLEIPAAEILTECLKRELDEGEGNALGSAETVICVGNGLRDSRHLEPYRRLAELLGAALGCTRPVVDRGILPYECQIGQSGIGVRPKLYVCFGVSGAVNHVSGVHAERFVAVNSDPDAAVFHYCDYGIVGDMDEVCKEMISILEGGK